MPSIRCWFLAIDTATGSAIRAAVEPFAGDVIAKMVVICALLRAATFGRPEEGPALRGTVTAVDGAARRVIADGRAIAYDALVLATAATHGYFGRDEWAAHAPGLKSIADAISIRSRILDAFEKAEASEDAVAQRKLLTFLICGAGPTGVEMAGAIAELARKRGRQGFPQFRPRVCRILLVQAGSRVLPQFDESLSAFARASLEALGVEVCIDSRVEQIDGSGVVVNGKRVEAGTVLWAAGVVASPASTWLGAEADSAGRIKVGPDLSVPGFPDIFAIGDTALSTAWEGATRSGASPRGKERQTSRHSQATFDGVVSRLRIGAAIK
jgi:NADH dehydrogenase FAD-containing subunit